METSLNALLLTYRSECEVVVGSLLVVPECNHASRNIVRVDGTHSGLYLISCKSVIPNLEVVNSTLDTATSVCVTTYCDYLSVCDVIRISLVARVCIVVCITVSLTVPACNLLLLTIDIEFATESTLCIIVECKSNMCPCTYRKLAVSILITDLVVAGLVSATPCERTN